MAEKTGGAQAKARPVLVLFLFILAATSCARGADRGGTGTASTRQSLTGAVTVTLSAPNGMSPIAPVLLGSNSVELGQNATVVSGTVVGMGTGSFACEAETAAQLNDAWSRGLAVIQDRVNLRGILHASQSTLGSGVLLGGSDRSPAFDPVSSLTWTVTFPSGSANNVDIPSGQAMTLGPGRYGNVSVHDRSALTLSSGTYYLTGLTLYSQSTVNLDQATGPIILYVSDTIGLRGAFASLQGGSPDLMIGYLGQNQVVLETVFDGAIIAPSALLALQPVGLHTGFFAAQDVDLRPGGQVQYRLPPAVVAAATPPGTTCNQLLAGLVPPDQLFLYCSCVSPDDTDRDHVPDCLDLCPYDPNKTQPGMCGCGIADSDSDCDGVPDCLDQCPLDPNNTEPGECGCLGQANLQPAGMLCTDSACPQSGATCDGAGVCGNRAACQPGPNCKLITRKETSYWVCGETFPSVGGCADAGASDSGAGGGLTQTAAQLACASKGLSLTRIESLSDNRWINLFLSRPLWLGANDISVAGTWRWASPSGNNGDQFWSGGPSGSTVNSRFAYWAPGAPGSQRCAAMLPFDGHWTDVACNEALGYICQFRTPFGIGPDGGPVGPVPPPGMPNQPPAGRACIPEPEAGLPDSAAELQNQILAARDGGPFVGAAANPPPPTSRCPADPGSNGLGLQPDAGAGCALINVIPNVDCIKDSDCSAFGTGYVCRQFKNDTTCHPPDAGSAPKQFLAGQACLGSGQCGQLSCRPDRAPCDQVEICNPGTTFDAGLDDGSTISPRPFNPASLFDGGIPDSGASAAYSDPSGPGRGENHPWCFMKAQDPNSVQPAVAPPGQYHGQAGGSSQLGFQFDPDLVFDVEANPLALGETKLHLHALGALRASVSLKGFLGQDFQGKILDASIGITADRCSLSDTHDTKFQVFGLDFIDPFDFGIPKFDTSDPKLNPRLSKLSQSCEDSIGKFVLFADRAKKAFRDAQQLLTQYHSLKSIGSNLGDLCNSIGVLAATVPDFPGGNFCYANETPEITINRFIQYFQLPGSGAVSQLKDAMGALSSATQTLTQALDLPKINTQFGVPDKEESQTIFSAAFAIGPVPMVLEVDVFAAYGVPGKLDIALHFPINLEGNTLNKPMEVAGVKASVVPHASAGLSAFVGAGFNFGSLSVELGLEGAVNLADVKIPVFAGASLDEIVTRDFRPIPKEVGPPISTLSGVTQFGLPTAFKFAVNYDYGIRLDIDDILKGSINAKIHIDFLFFSRTWRKQVIQFNGFSIHQDIISGGADPSVSAGTQGAGNPMASSAGTANVASGPAPMGRAENPVPLMQLAYLQEPDAGTDSSVGFDAGDIQGFFYDDLCCAKPPEFCSVTGTPHCCPGSTCVVTGSPIPVGNCVTQCGDFGAKCSQNSDCCSSICGASRRCVSACIAKGGSCTTTADCCPGTQCDSSHTCAPLPCNSAGACVTSRDCCPTFDCISNLCQQHIQ